jgi:hypothetical protein
MLYCIKYQVSFSCVGTSNSTIFVGQNCSSPIARPWTQWVQRLPVQVHVHKCLYMYIMLCYAYTLCMYYGCINLKNIFVRTTKLIVWLHNVLCNIAQNILDMCTFFKVSCFQPRQFNRGDMRVVGYCKFFLSDWSTYMSLIFCKFVVGASRFVVGALHLVVPPGYRPGLFFCPVR